MGLKDHYRQLVFRVIELNGEKPPVVYHRNWKASSDHIRYWYQKTYLPNAMPAGIPKDQSYHKKNLKGVSKIQDSLTWTSTENNEVMLYYTGLILCSVWVGSERYLGFSRNHHTDRFDKFKGKVIALGRAMATGPRAATNGRLFVPNIPNTLYNLGAPWWLYYEKKPDRWPEREYVQSLPYDHIKAHQARIGKLKRDEFSGFKAELGPAEGQALQ